MNKKIIIVTSIIIIMIALGVFVAIFINTNKDNQISDNENSNSDNENISGNNETNNNENNNNETIKDYTNINPQSSFSQKIFENLPSNYLTLADKNTNEYKIYTALYNLVSNEIKTEEYIDSVLPAYSIQTVLSEVKKIFGENTEVEFNIDYKLDIVYDGKNDLLAIKPTSNQGMEEYIYMAEVREYDDYLLAITYFIQIKYSETEANVLYIATNDTYELFMSGIIDENQILSTMKQFAVTDTNVSLEKIIELYGEELPKIEYKLLKNEVDDTYYIESINMHK